MRLFARRRFNVAGMAPPRPEQVLRLAELPVRLHDVSTGVAIASGLLKGAASRASDEVEPTLGRALELLEGSLRQLRTLTAATTSSRDWRRSRPALVASIQREAGRLKLRLEVDLNGKEAWLPPNHADLIFLVCTEALRNVRRHAGTSAARIGIDLASCPNTHRIKDWGGGIADRERGGSGLELLARLAADMGCQLGVVSQPGFGTEIVLVGPVCARDRSPSQPDDLEPRRSAVGPQTSRQHTPNTRRSMVKTEGSLAD